MGFKELGASDLQGFMYDSSIIMMFGGFYKGFGFAAQGQKPGSGFRA